MNTTNINRVKNAIFEMRYCHKKMGVLQDRLEELRCTMFDAIQEAVKIEKELPRGDVKTATFHPDALTTEDEYKNAPGGTIVADDRGLPACLWNDGKWALWMERASHRGMSGTTRRVLRWGWEA